MQFTPEADQLFTPDADYDAISTKLHKPHPPAAGTPSVVRHLGFWIPNDARGATENADAARDRWLLSADAFLVGIYAHAHAQWRKEAKAATATGSDRESATNAFSLRHEPQILTASRTTALLFASEFTPFSKDGPPDDLSPGTSFRLDVSVGRERRYESITLKFVCEGVPIKLRATLYQEYFTLTVIAQFWHGDPTQPLAGNVKKVIESFEGGLTDRWAKIMTHLDGHERADEQQVSDGSENSTCPSGDDLPDDETENAFKSDIRKMHGAADFLYKGIWDVVDEKIFNPVFTNNLLYQVRCGGDLPFSENVVKISKDAQPLRRSDIGGIFCDLRSCLFSVGVDDRYTVKSDRIPPPTKSSRLTRIQSFSQNNLFKNRRRQELASYTSPHVFTARDSINVVDTFLPFLEASTLSAGEVEVFAGGKNDASDSSQDNVLQRREYTASLFLDRRAIHLSSLSGDSEIGYPKPSKYLLVFRHRHRWQIGRLVERMNRLGTLRLASLKRWKRLREVGHNLQRLPLGAKLRPGTTAADLGNKDLLSSLQAYDAVFSSVVHPREDGAGEVASGGSDSGRVDAAGRPPMDGSAESVVMHWIERSIHYIREFEHTVGDLRASRIEGFQPYPEFVRRRIAGTWASVEGLAARIERAQRHVGYLLQSEQIKNIHKTEKLNTRISTKTLVLQGAAELAAPVAVAYYGGHLLSYIGNTTWMVANMPYEYIFGSLVPNSHSDALVVNAFIALCLYYTIQIKWFKKSIAFIWRSIWPPFPW